LTTFTQIPSIWWKDRENRSSRSWDSFAQFKKKNNASIIYSPGLIKIKHRRWQHNRRVILKPQALWTAFSCIHCRYKAMVEGQHGHLPCGRQYCFWRADCRPYPIITLNIHMGRSQRVKKMLPAGGVVTTRHADNNSFYVTCCRAILLSWPCNDSR